MSGNLSEKDLLHALKSKYEESIRSNNEKLIDDITCRLHFSRTKTNIVTVEKSEEKIIEYLPKEQRSNYLYDGNHISINAIVEHFTDKGYKCQVFNGTTLSEIPYIGKYPKKVAIICVGFSINDKFEEQVIELINKSMQNEKEIIDKIEKQKQESKVNKPSPPPPPSKSTHSFTNMITNMFKNFDRHDIAILALLIWNISITLTILLMSMNQ